jgi:hypothetical protein
MALRLRRSQFMNEYLKGQLLEEKELSALLGSFNRKKGSERRVSPVKRAKRASKQK